MQFNINNKQRLKVIYMFMLQLYKMTMGTLLVLFIPQKCEENYCSTLDVISSDNVVSLMKKIETSRGTHTKNWNLMYENNPLGIYNLDVGTMDIYYDNSQDCNGVCYQA